MSRSRSPSRPQTLPEPRQSPQPLQSLQPDQDAGFQDARNQIIRQCAIYTFACVTEPLDPPRDKPQALRGGAVELDVTKHIPRTLEEVFQDLQRPVLPQDFAKTNRDCARHHGSETSTQANIFYHSVNCHRSGLHVVSSCLQPRCAADRPLHVQTGDVLVGTRAPAPAAFRKSRFPFYFERWCDNGRVLWNFMRCLMVQSPQQPWRDDTAELMQAALQQSCGSAGRDDFFALAWLLWAPKANFPATVAALTERVLAGTLDLSKDVPEFLRILSDRVMSLELRTAIDKVLQVLLSTPSPDAQDGTAPATPPSASAAERPVLLSTEVTTVDIACESRGSPRYLPTTPPLALSVPSLAVPAAAAPATPDHGKLPQSPIFSLDSPQEPSRRSPVRVYDPNVADGDEYKV